MRSMHNEHGFSLLLVMLILVVLSVVGVSVMTGSLTEAGVAGARTMQRQALAAAEAGLNHFFASKPAMVQPDTYYIGSIGTGEGAYVYLEDSRAANGEVVKARYRVRSTSDSPGVDSVILLSEGEVLVNGHVAGRALVSAVVTATPGGSSGVVGQGQKSLGAWGTSSNMPARSDVSLVDFE